MVEMNFGLNQYKKTAPTGGGNPVLPAGFYSGIVTRVTLKNNSDRAKDPNGQYIEVEFDITSPSNFSNRKMWQRFNTRNANQDSVRIGLRDLSDLVEALGFSGEPNDTDEMLGRECSFKLDVIPAKGEYQAKNVVKKYFATGATEDDYKAWLKSSNGSEAGAQPAAVEKPKWGGASQPAQETKAATPSWKK